MANKDMKKEKKKPKASKIPSVPLKVKIPMGKKENLGSAKGSSGKAGTKDCGY